MEQRIQHHIHYKFSGDIEEWDSTWLFASHGLLEHNGLLFPQYELQDGDSPEDFQEQVIEGWDNYVPDEIETEIIDERIHTGGSN